MMRSGRKAPEPGHSWDGLLALFPLALVACAIAFLAFGAARVSSGPEAKPPAPALAQSSAESLAVEEAAAAAVVAISLARVAPALPEEALEPPKPVKPLAQAASANSQQDARKPAPRREASAQTGKAAREGAAGQARSDAAQTPTEGPLATKPDSKPAAENPGVLARIAGYAPSPSRIAGAVSDGVSKIVSYIPGL